MERELRPVTHDGLVIVDRRGAADIHAPAAPDHGGGFGRPGEQRPGADCAVDRDVAIQGVRARGAIACSSCRDIRDRVVRVALLVPAQPEPDGKPL